MSTRARPLICAAASALALAISACGGGGGGVSSDDPASLAPASSPVYIQAVLRPRGHLKSDVEALASTVSGYSDPSAQLSSLINRALRQAHPLSGRNLSFEKDIKPWLGSRAGIFVEGLSGNPPAAGIIQTTNEKAARKTLQDSREKGDKQRTYKGIDYLLGSDGTAGGVLDGFMVIGNEKAFKDAVDVAQGSDALGDQSTFTKALDQAPSGSLVDAYANLQAITDTVRANNPQSAKGLEGTIGDTTGKSVVASLLPAKDSLELDLATDASQNVQLSNLSQLIGSLPSNSFAAIGIPDLGSRVEQTIAQLEKAGVPGVSRKAIDDQLAPTGFQLKDITAALGDLGVFAQGSDRRSLQGAGVIESKDPAKAKELIGKLTDLALASGQAGVARSKVGTGFSITDRRQLGPQPLTIAVAGDRVVIGYGDQASRQALSGGGRSLTGDPAFKQAGAVLAGSGLSGYVALPAVFRLADALGALRDRGYQQARSYLDKLTYAAIGSGKQGDFSTTKVVVGVRR